MVFKNKTNKTGHGWGATFSSRRDLAEREQARYAGCEWLEQCTVVPVTVVTSKAAAAKRRSEVKPEGARATKLAQRLRKAGIRAEKNGKRVYVSVARDAQSPADWAEISAQSKFGTPEREKAWNDFSKLNRRNQRYARLAIRHYLKERGFGADLDIIYFWV